MKKSLALLTLSLIGLGVGVLLLARGLRPAATGPVHTEREPARQDVAEEQRPDWRRRWETLKAQVLARLDEAEQGEDELSDQTVATKKADAALSLAQRELDVAERSLREYKEGTARVDRDLAESELALSEADTKLAASLAERRVRPAAASADDPPPAPVAVAVAGFDEQTLPRARAAFEQAKLKRDVLVRLTQPRRSAELAKEVARAQADLAQKEAALEQEREDESKLKRQQLEGTLTPDERQALAHLAAIGPLAEMHDDDGRSPDASLRLQHLDKGAALWLRASQARDARRDEATRLRLLRASKSGTGRVDEE